MKAYMAALRGAYPDFWVEIDQIGTCDVNSIFVTYQVWSSNLALQQLCDVPSLSV